MSGSRRYTTVPDPRERVTIDPAEVGSQAMYHLMNAAIAPRPVAWVSTVSPDGVANVAPHSYTTIFGTDPPVVGFVSVGRKKDSATNAEATGDFVLNIASLALVHQLNRSAADFPPEEDEFRWAGLSHVAGDLVRAPRVGEAPVSFEARTLQTLPVSNCFLTLGEVVRVHVARDVWRDGRIDPHLLDPVLRLSGATLGQLGDTFELQRPTWRGILAERQAQDDDATKETR